MKSIIFSTLFAIVISKGFGQYINDTIPRFPLLVSSISDSLISRHISDSANIVLKSIYSSGDHWDHDLQFDSLHFMAHLDANHPWYLLINKENEIEFFITKLYPGGTKIEEFYTRKGSKVRSIKFGFHGQILSYMECDYLKCDECIIERTTSEGKSGWKSTTYLRPVTCIGNLDWMRLKPEYKQLGAVPMRKVEYQGGVVILDEPIPLEQSYYPFIDVD